MERKKHIGVLISGSGSNLQSLIDHIASGYIPNAEIVLVISNTMDAYGLTRAQKAGIETFFLDLKKFESSEAYSKEIVRLMGKKEVDLICLAGFLKKIEKPLIEKYRNRIINIHPALLPKYGGKGMYGHFVHEAVLRSEDTESGPTVHFVDEKFDHGPIILQKKIPVLPHDTPETLAERVLKEEHTIYPEAVKLFCEGKLKIVNDKVIIR